MDLLKTLLPNIKNEQFLMWLSVFIITCMAIKELYFSTKITVDYSSSQNNHIKDLIHLEIEENGRFLNANNMKVLARHAFIKPSNYLYNYHCHDLSSGEKKIIKLGRFISFNEIKFLKLKKRKTHNFLNQRILLIILYKKLDFL